MRITISSDPYNDQGPKLHEILRPNLDGQGAGMLFDVIAVQSILNNAPAGSNGVEANLGIGLCPCGASDRLAGIIAPGADAVPVQHRLA
jgi:hypothetical protein